MIKIVQLDPFLMFPEHIVSLRKMGELILHDTVPQNDEDIIDRIKDADIVINFWTTLTKNVIGQLKKTKMICIAAAGYDWIDVTTATVRNITITHCPGHNAESVAEQTIGLLLSALRHNILAITETKAGKYDPEGYKSMELKGRTIGIIGYGMIGKRVAEIAKNGFGMKVLFTNSKSTKEDFNQLLKESDVISVNLPLNDETRNLLGAEEFDLMKERVIIINTARGAIIDEQALFDALKEGKVYAAGLDTLATEPYDINSPLFNLPNVIITPHTAWNTEETDYRLSAQVVDIVESYVDGAPLFVVPEQKNN